MKREAENVMDRAKAAGTSASSQKLLQNELLLFTTYVRRAPRSIQRHLAPYFFELHKEMPNDSRIKEIVQTTCSNEDSRPDASEFSRGLLLNFFRLLQLKLIPSMLAKAIQNVESDRLRPQSKSKQIFGKSEGFDKLDLLHPQYDTYFKMSKQERLHHLPQHHPKTKFKEFFTEPRFLVRIEELAHFHSNQKLKGDILFLQYEGNVIAGSKVFAVSRDNLIEVWEMESSIYPIPTLILPATDQEKKNENPKDREKEREDEERKEKEQKLELQKTKFAMNGSYNGHLQKITSLSFSLDQFYLISGSSDRTVRLWCLRLKICLCIFRGHQRTVWDVHFSPSGYYFLSGSGDGCMILWKTDEPHAQRVYNHKNDVYKVSFAKDPSFVISAGEDGTVKIWKTLQAELIRELRLAKPVITFDIGFSGSYLVAVESDGRITVFDLFRGETINSFYFYEDGKAKGNVIKRRIHDVALSQDERQLSCVSGRSVVVYSMERLEMKVPNNIYSFFESNNDTEKVTRLLPKEVIYMGIDMNLTWCNYVHKNVLVVAGTDKN